MGRISAAGPMGRPPKPLALKLLHGNEPKPSRRGEPLPSGAPVVPPGWLTKPGREMWEELAPDMIRVGLLTSWDAPIFGEFCEALVLARIARVTAMKEASGQTIPPPGSASSVTSWVKAMVVVSSLSARYGMTPGDRVRLATGGLGTEVRRGNTNRGEDLLSG